MLSIRNILRELWTGVPNRPIPVHHIGLLQEEAGPQEIACNDSYTDQRDI